MKKLTMYRKSKVLGAAIAAVLFLTCILPIQAAYATWPAVIEGKPNPVIGRILTPEMTGDVKDWIEIAKHEDKYDPSRKYSLIVRTGFLNRNNLMAHYDNPAWQYINYGPTQSNTYFNVNSYSTSHVNKIINDWFNGVAYQNADNLCLNARLRDYTIMSDAKQNLGNCISVDETITGISRPTRYQVGIGDDIAFALSYSECAKYLSKLYYENSNASRQLKSSTGIAIANYERINIPVNYLMWLRSPAEDKVSAGILESSQNASTNGRVSQRGNTSYGYIYPALWVDQGIFEYDEDEDRKIPPRPGNPVGVDGRILSSRDLAGNIVDDVDWVEIAQSGAHSLIVRSNFINVYPRKNMGNITYHNDYRYQSSAFGTTTKYRDGDNVVRDKINGWFNRTAPGEADKLDEYSILREFAVQHDSVFVTGTCTSKDSLTNGFSRPYPYYQVGYGDDIAFALSYGECANFLSLKYFQRFEYLANQVSPKVAQDNFNKIYMPPRDGVNYINMWLRSVGDVPNSVGTLTNLNNKIPMDYDGRVFQSFITDVGHGFVQLIYPALWVYSDIFSRDKNKKDNATVRVAHECSLTEEILSLDINRIPAGSYDFGPKNFDGYYYDKLKEDSAPASGTIQAGQEITIVFQYLPKNKVIYYPNGGTGSIKEVTIKGSLYVIEEQKDYARRGYSFVGWNTRADGYGRNHFNNELAYVDEILELYAKWLPDF